MPSVSISSNPAEISDVLCRTREKLSSENDLMKEERLWEQMEIWERKRGSSNCNEG